MRFPDEPEPGQPLPILPGHCSPGRLERLLRAGVFAVTTELAPPDSADPAEVLARARVFDGWVDAINATDGSGANCHMSSVAVCALLTRLGYAPVMQVSCRDRNRIAIQGEVLGAAAMGVCNLLCLSGDGVQAGDHPQAKPVFDLDSVSLLELVRTMREESRFQSGRPLGAPPRLFLGAVENPFAPPLEFRAERLAKKAAAGAQFVQTQWCHDVPRLRQFMARVRDLGLLEGPSRLHVLVGVGPLGSLRRAQWVHRHVPGIHIPEAVMARLAGATDPFEESKRMCIETIQALREVDGVAGIHVMAFRQEHTVAEILERSGVLGDRVPWFPGEDAACPAAGQRRPGAPERRTRA